MKGDTSPSKSSLVVLVYPKGKIKFYFEIAQLCSQPVEVSPFQWCDAKLFFESDSYKFM